MNIFRQLSLLFAGVCAGVLGRLILVPPVAPYYILSLCLIIILFVLYGSGAISQVWHNYNVWRRNGKILMPPKIGVLSDMGWDQNNQEIAVWADISPQEWKKEIEKQAAENKN